MPAKVQANPTTTTTAGTSSQTSAGGSGPVRQPAGNGAAQESVRGKVDGPIGRVWNRILGQPDGADTSDKKIDQAMVRAYLDTKLQFAEGEMFRGKKLDGVAANLVSKFDKDGDKKLGWPEFQGFEATLYAMLAPEAAAGKGDAASSAAGEFAKVDGSKDGNASLDEIQDRAVGALPPDTDYKDLVGQLGARVALDAADKDEGHKPVSQRSLSASEWSGAAKALKR